MALANGVIDLVMVLQCVGNEVTADGSVWHAASSHLCRYLLHEQECLM
jgi:hypothetical protein